MTPNDCQHNLELLLYQTKTTLEKQAVYFQARKSGTQFQAQAALKEAKREEAILNSLIENIERKINLTQTELF